ITAGSNMSDEDIEKAIKEAAQFEAEDRKRKEGVDARNEADSIVFQTEKALKEVGDKIDASAKATVESEIADLKAILERTKDQTDISDADIDALKSGKEKLMNDSQQLFTQMYQNMQNNQGAGPDMGGHNAGGSASGDDDVVDGDYREV
ncbi:MAG: Hsp70 family protein, partial [Bacillota bacterium]